MIPVADNQERSGSESPQENQTQADRSPASDSLSPETVELMAAIENRLGLKAEPRSDGWLDLPVPAEQVQQVGLRLRDELKMNYLACLSAVDWKDEGFEVVYHVLELGTSRRIVLRARVPRDNPSLPTVTPVWPTANWHEREAWDLMGVRFEGHPDLRRILMREDWVGHPLRKDYVDQRPQRERKVKL